ncbi:MAG: hypothetical protein FJ044_05520 [Candidatus Cloacimonetes bacterium]|nr:hypothetical protein [Candidatus Cloacimonadota bacterium]
MLRCQKLILLIFFSFLLSFSFFFCRQVIAIERIEILAEKTKSRLKDLGFSNVEVIVGDGSKGVPSEAPFDAINARRRLLLYLRPGMNN